MMPMRSYDTPPVVLHRFSRNFHQTGARMLFQERELLMASAISAITPITNTKPPTMGFCVYRVMKPAMASSIKKYFRKFGTIMLPGTVK
jgi:hypothetical protein